MLIGQDTQAAQFVDALHRGQLHHAWLLAGPRGVGKRAFADAAALRLLAGTGDGLAVADDHPTAQLVAAGSHLDHRVVQREVDDRGKVAGEIKVEQVRMLQPLFRTTPGLGDWRTIIIDSIDDLNLAAANAFLKNLEEPPAKTVFFLISHAPSRLLPTIRSRCRMLRFAPLSDLQVAQVLRAQGVAEPDIPPLVTLAAGAPGEALRLSGADVAGLAQALDQLMSGGDVTVFARAFQPQAAAARFEAMLTLASARLAETAKHAGDEVIRARALALEARCSDLVRDAVRLAFDRVQVAFAVGTLLANAGRLSGK